MRVGDFMEGMLRVEGVRGIRMMPDDLIRSVASTEASIDTVSGGMRLENMGLFQCIHSPYVFVLFCDPSFERPNEITMRMIDSEGVVIGHDVPPAMMDDYIDRRDIFWMSDGFVMFPDRIGNRDAKMVMGCSRYRCGWLPDDVRVRMFYPSVSSAESINSRFGMEEDGISSAVLGVDGLED